MTLNQDAKYTEAFARAFSKSYYELDGDMMLHNDHDRRRAGKLGRAPRRRGDLFDWRTRGDTLRMRGWSQSHYASFDWIQSK